MLGTYFGSESKMLNMRGTNPACIEWETVVTKHFKMYHDEGSTEFCGSMR
jgi:hypothetical protein